MVARPLVGISSSYTESSIQYLTDSQDYSVHYAMMITVAYLPHIMIVPSLPT